MLNKSLLDSLYGIKVIESPNAVIQEPVRKLNKKKWMSRFYTNRIQKKWNKRYGYKQVPTMYKINDNVIIIHPILYNDLKKHIG